MGRGLQAAPGLVCFDLDGTLYLEDTLLPGAAELRGKLNYAETMAEMEALLNEYLKNHQ